MNRETEGLPKSVIDGLANLGAEQATAAPAEPFTEEVAPQEPASAEPAAPAEEPTAAPEKKVYNNYDDYVADGNDPAFYQGPKAFELQQKILSEKKEERQKVANLEHMMGDLMSKQTAQLNQQKEEYERKLEEARENEDFAAFEIAKNGLDNLNLAMPSASPVPNGEDPTIAAYRQSNPKVNPTSPSYDSNYEALFKNALNKSCIEAEQRVGRRLTSLEIQQHIDSVEQQVNGYLNPAPSVAPPVSAAPSRVATPSRTPAAADPLSKMNAEEKALYNKWAKSSDPTMQGYAEKMKQRYASL